MARILVTQGACPVCDEPVARTVHRLAGTQRETYHCPTDGRLAYGPADVPLHALEQANSALATPDGFQPFP